MKNRFVFRKDRATLVVNGTSILIDDFKDIFSSSGKIIDGEKDLIYVTRLSKVEIIELIEKFKSSKETKE